MKTFLTLLFIIISSPVFSFSQCENETVSNGKILKEITISTKNTDIVALKINAGGTKSSWLIKNSEAGALTIFVNGKYNQDVLLFAGEKIFEYNILLGTLVMPQL